MFGTPTWGQIERRIAETMLRRSPASTLPVVLWQGLAETTEAFRARVVAARSRLAREVRLIAACRPHEGPIPEGVTLCEFPPKLFVLLHPRASKTARYRVAYGGRGSGKSWAFARALLLRALVSPIRVLCGRELQGSIQESVHRLLADQIDVLGLARWFTVQQTTIYSSTGAEFIFTGIRNNVSKVKSTEGISIFWGEEAEKFSEASWQIVVPTVRQAGSEIWCSFNPDSINDPTYRRFVTTPPPETLSAHVNFGDNPWLPRELDADQRYLASVDPDAWAWIWGGEPRAASDAIIFKGKWSIETFSPDKDWDGPYLGADWGFAQDPTTLVKAWIAGRTLYIEFEAWAVGCDIDRTPVLFDLVPDARRYTIRADNARPETISYMQRHGYANIVAVSKWSGSIEDGIAHLRQYERIVVHSRCLHVQEELRLYSYKVDRISGDVLPDVVDKHNHCIDALRYALAPMIHRPNTGMLEFYRQEVERKEALNNGLPDPYPPRNEGIGKSLPS